MLKINTSTEASPMAKLDDINTDQQKNELSVEAWEAIHNIALFKTYL